LAAPPDAPGSGVLQDNSGTTIGVTVILSNLSGKAACTARAKAIGEFLFSAIAPATYKVAVSPSDCRSAVGKPLLFEEGKPYLEWTGAYGTSTKTELRVGWPIFMPGFIAERTERRHRRVYIERADGAFFDTAQGSV